MTGIAAFFAVFVFTVLTVSYNKGRRFVLEHHPDSLVKFHFIMVAVRFLFAVTMVGIFAVLSDSREELMSFAAVVLVSYFVMIAVTLIVKH